MQRPAVPAAGRCAHHHRVVDGSPAAPPSEGSGRRPAGAAGRPAKRSRSSPGAD